VWTSWCSQFLTDAGFQLLGLPHLERALRSAGWNGSKLSLYTDVDAGSGFGYGSVLIDEGVLGEHPERWLKHAQRHLGGHHMSYVNEGSRTICIGGPRGT
jgi:hypothetical protein